MQLATKKSHQLAGLTLVAIACVFAVTPAYSQVDNGDPIFDTDHYLVYFTPDPLTIAAPLLLRDQFGESQHGALLLERFATPVDKNLEGIIDPRSHLTWWRLDGDLFSPLRRVVVTNQFGVYELAVFEAEYLLAPALKNPAPGEPPSDGKDHCKCYRAEGKLAEAFVTLQDQFRNYESPVFAPSYLCNPVEKHHLDNGEVFPIFKPSDHLVCYDIPLQPVSAPPVVFRDQFIEAQVQLFDAHLLCVPSLKEEVVQADESSWGKIKSIYR